MDHVARLGVQVGEPGDDLRRDRARLALGERARAARDRVEVAARAELEHGRERVVVDLEDVEERDDARVVERAVDVVLPDL